MTLIEKLSLAQDELNAAAKLLEAEKAGRVKAESERDALKADLARAAAEAAKAVDAVKAERDAALKSVEAEKAERAKAEQALATAKAELANPAFAAARASGTPAATPDGGPVPSGAGELTPEQASAQYAELAKRVNASAERYEFRRKHWRALGIAEEK